MELCGDSDIISFVRISRLIWIGHDNRIDSNRKVRQVFNNNPQRSVTTGRPKKKWWNCVQTDVNRCKIKKPEREVKKERPFAEVHYLGEGPHWNVVPSKKKSCG